MSNRTLALAAIASALLMIACTLALGDALAHADARPVALSDARSAPDAGTFVFPDASADYPEQCPHGGYFSDVSAYRWDGSPLSAQRWDESGPRIVWRDRSGRAVTFDGITFRNHTRHPVIVAGWC